MAKIPGTAFETETCSRCGGCGEYSHCEMYGKTCFKCHGKGRTLTKRAAVAVAWASQQNLIPAATVEVGMRVKALGVTITVRTIEPGCQSKSMVNGVWIDNPQHLSFRGVEHGFQVQPDTMVQVIRSHEDQIAQRLAAIEYQNSLTKAGTPRKRQMEAA
jgi:hypothetical protein